MKIENIIKGIFTTLLGIAIMTFAFYGWYFEQTDPLTDWQAIIMGAIGFVLVFVRVKLEETLGKLLGDLPSMVWAKFFGKKPEDKKE